MVVVEAGRWGLTSTVLSIGAQTDKPIFKSVQSKTVISVSQLNDIKFILLTPGVPLNKDPNHRDVSNFKYFYYKVYY